MTTITDQIQAIEADAAARVAKLRQLQAQTTAEAAQLAVTDAQRADADAARQAQEAAMQALGEDLPDLTVSLQPAIVAAMGWQEKVQQAAGILGALADEQAAIHRDLVAAAGVLGRFYAQHAAAYPDPERRKQVLQDTVVNFLQQDEWLAAPDLPPAVRREYRIRQVSVLADCHAAAVKALAGR